VVRHELLQPEEGLGGAGRRYLLCCGVAAAVLTLQSCSKSAPGNAGGNQLPAAPVSVATATLKTLPVVVHAIGNVEPIISISVRAQVNGELSKVFFTEGEFVKKGQTLLLIDPQPYESQVAQAQANLAKDIAQLNLAKANLARDVAQDKFAHEQAQRNADLLKEGVLSKMQSDQTQSDADARAEAVRADQAALESAQAAIDADQAALDRSKLQLGYCTILSPIDGRTGAVTVKPGNLITANNTEFTTINQVQPVYVTFSVPEKILSDVRKFMVEGKLPVGATLQDDTASETGVLAFVDNTVDPATGTIKLKGSFQNEDRKLWPGQFVKVTLQLSTQPNSLVVPSQAVQTGPDNQYIFVVKPDQTVEMRTVTSGMQVDQETAITKGLQPGEIVVTEGQLRLVPGSRVKIQGSSSGNQDHGGGSRGSGGNQSNST
jgi:membrane fusion protein, multidrug efflux system